MAIVEVSSAKIRTFCRSGSYIRTCLLIEKYIDGKIQPDREEEVDDVEKLQWLFHTRNSYTHNLHTVESNITPGKRERGETWMRRDVFEKKERATVVWVVEDFNDVLIECLNLGILKLIER